MSNDMLLYALACTGKDGPPREAPIPLDGPDPRTVRRPRGEGYEPKRSKRSAVSEHNYPGAFLSFTLASPPFSEMNSTPTASRTSRVF
jgi:hypothetical protein